MKNRYAFSICRIEQRGYKYRIKGAGRLLLFLFRNRKDKLAIVISFNGAVRLMRWLLMPRTSSKSIRPFVSTKKKLQFS